MAEGLCGYRSGIPMRPMNWTLMPVCSNRRPSLGLTVTAPFTDSPSMYSGAFSRLFLSSLTSTVCRSSASSRTMSISTGVEKKKEDMTLTPSDWALQEALSIRSTTVACVRLACYSPEMLDPSQSAALAPPIGRFGLPRIISCHPHGMLFE
jgi:hypothetical protein